MTPGEREANNKALIRRWLGFGEAGFVGDFEKFLSPDYVGVVSGRTMDFYELVKAERDFAAAFADTQYAIEDWIAEGDKVVVRVTTKATHTGEFLGIAPTGRRVQFSGIVIYRIHNSKIAESWGELDFAGLWRQLTSVVS